MEQRVCLSHRFVRATSGLRGWSVLLFFTSIAAALCACGGGSSQSTTVNHFKITITLGTNPVQSGDFVAMSASATDASGNPTGTQLGTVTWGSTNETVAKVRADGLLLALDPGSTTISANGGGLAGSLPVTVSSSPGAPGTISFSYGPEEVVFRHTTDACEPLDVPDVPARAIRLGDGTLVLIDGDAPHNHALFGADFSSLKRSCTPIYISDDNTSAASFDNQEWVQTAYREGNVIHALLHNEYHDPFAANCQPGNTSPGNPCWYNSITYASSVDGGRSFTHVVAPGHVAAPAAQVWDPTGSPPPYGYFESSNIVQGKDGLFYAVFTAIDKGKSVYTDMAICVMRTPTLADPASWRAWDGSGFNLKMSDPYLGPAASFCTIVGNPSPNFSQGLTYNTYLQKYLLVGGGGYYSLSTDLINWTASQPIRPEESPSVAYATVIDHDDPTANFESPGRTPYLYFTRFNGTTIRAAGLNRDLIRVPMIITAH